MDGIKINGELIYQPDANGLAYSFETTYTEDSTRTQDGKGHFTPMFTVEQLGYSATHVPVEDASKILKNVAKGDRFQLTYFSAYYGTWRTDTFYVGKGQMSVGMLTDNDKFLSSLSFNMTGVNPI